MGLKTLLFGEKKKDKKKLKKNKLKDDKKKHKKTKKNVKPSKKNFKSKNGAVLVADEEFHNIKNECYDAVQEIIDQGEQFFDEEFNMYDDEACLSTVYGPYPQHDFSMNDFSNANYYLRRLTDVYGDLDLKVFYQGASSGDIVQGCNGTCFYMGALMCVAEHHKFINQLVVNYSIELGVYGVMFFADGEWTYVIIDDFFPFYGNGQLMTSASVDTNELWVCLFEKAYAKLYGSFDMVDGGYGSYAIIDLTGGIPIRLPYTWEALSGAIQSSCYCITCNLFVQGTDKDRINNGLIPGHIYSILNTVECDGIRLINLRNPHGCGEWTGDYSDSSRKWTPRLKAACNHVNKDDGSFWMTFDDFLAWFMVDCVRLFTKDYSYSKITGYESCYGYDEEEADEYGCTNNLYYEGYYVLDLHEDADVAICLTQADPRKCEDWESKRDDEYAVGFTVMKFDCEVDDVVAAYENSEYEIFYDTGPLRDRRDVAYEADLAAGIYVVVPRFDYAGCEYSLRLFTTSSTYEFDYYYVDDDEEYDEEDDEEYEEEDEEDY